MAVRSDPRPFPCGNVTTRCPRCACHVCTVTAVGDPNPTPQQVGFAGGDPVQVVDTDIDGACHDYIERQVGNVTGVFSQFDGGDGGREQYVTITGTGEAGFDGQLMVPLAAIGDLIELLHSVQIPEGVE